MIRSGVLRGKGGARALRRGPSTLVDAGRPRSRVDGSWVCALRIKGRETLRETVLSSYDL